MGINYILLVSRQGTHTCIAQVHGLVTASSSLHPIAPLRRCVSRFIFALGKVRLAKWYQTLPSKSKTKIVKDVTQLVLARRTRMCNFLEYKGPFGLLLSPRSGDLLCVRLERSVQCQMGVSWGVHIMRLQLI